MSIPVLPWLLEARREFHKTLLSGPLTVGSTGIPSIADKSSRPSVQAATGILEELDNVKEAAKLPGQTAGADFENICAAFIEICFKRVGHLRAGDFSVGKGGDISQFDQYSHLAELDKLAKENREIATAIGSDYLIKPDIIVRRKPVSDDEINIFEKLVDPTIANLTPLREMNSPLDTLHASISCKWTLRSDRAQNARSEGLNLVRNRKGRLPHIAVITAEPMPSRIASLALGTGDIDCVYHFALPELERALRKYEREDALDLLQNMIAGKRLRDIADLPLDLLI